MQLIYSNVHIETMITAHTLFLRSLCENSDVIFLDRGIFFWGSVAPEDNTDFVQFASASSLILITVSSACIVHADPRTHF